MKLEKKCNFALFLIVVNFFYWIFCSYLGVFRPLFNIDYILLWCIFFYVNKRNFIYLLFFIFFSIFEIFYIISQIYPLAFISDILILFYQSRGIHYIIYLYLLFLFLFLFLLYRLNVFILSRFSVGRNIKQCFLILFYIILCFIYVKDNYFISSATLDYFLKSRTILNGKENFRQLYPLESSSPIYKKISENLSSDKKSKKVILILNESYGSFKSDEINKDIIADIYKNKNIFDFIETGSFISNGITKDGEFRELCNKISKTLKLAYIIKGFDSCLPNIFLYNNYHTISFHGASENLYDRKSWYPKVGFREYYFDKDFMSLPQCKTFKGKCDHDLIKEIASHLAKHESIFIYWLTLNTHQPYDDIFLYQSKFSCLKHNIDDKSETCKNAKSQSYFFSILAEIIDKKEMRSVDFYVVGDHPPPIINLNEKNEYYNGGIAWLHFRIK